MAFRDSLAFHPDFRRLWIGDAASQIGATTSLFMLPLFAATVLRATPFQVSLVSTALTASFLLLGLPAGALVDRIRRRRVLIAADIGRALVLGSLSLAAALGVLSLIQLYAVAFSYGVLTVFFDVAYQSYLPSLIGWDRLVEGNAKLAATQAVAQMGGPTVGGFAIQILSTTYAVAANSLCFAWSAAWIGLIRLREPLSAASIGSHFGKEIAEGLRFVAGYRLLRAIASCTGWFNLFRGVSQPMLIVLLASVLHLAAGTIGLFFSIGAIGGVMGAFFARRIATRTGHGQAIWGSMAIAGPFALLLPLAQDNWLLWLAATGMFGLSFSTAIYNVAQVSFRQAFCPERLLGRMNATMRVLVWGPMPIGALLGGGFAAMIGVRALLWVASVSMAFAFLPVFLSPLRSMRELPTAGE